MTLFRCRAAGLFGLAFIVAGLLGTVAGAELSKYIGRRTLKAECYVCALSLFGAVPFIYFGLIIAYYSKCISADWVCCYLLYTNYLILVYWYMFVPAASHVPSNFHDVFELGTSVCNSVG